MAGGFCFVMMRLNLTLSNLCAPFYICTFLEFILRLYLRKTKLSSYTFMAASKTANLPRIERLLLVFRCFCFCFGGGGWGLGGEAYYFEAIH